MDNLSRNAMLAKQANMSYGRWKALQPRVDPNDKEIPTGWKLCEWCGKPFKPRKTQRFCDIYCRSSAYYERTKGKKNE